MGNCGSSPAVKEDPAPIPKPTPPTAAKKAPGTQEKILTTPASGSASNSAPPESTEKPQDFSQPRNTKSLDFPQKSEKNNRNDESDDDSDDDSGEEDGEWKAKRRVSRRLSLEVKKKAPSKTGSPSPAFGAAPTAEEMAAWDAEADADMLMASPNDPASNPASNEAPPKALEKQGSTGATPSRLGPGFVEKTRGSGSDGEEEEEELEVPGAWRVRRRGRRLSLEVEKAPDLALLAAIRRSSSAPLTGAFARKAEEEERTYQEGLAKKKADVGAGEGSSAPRAPSLTPPLTSAPVVIDFARARGSAALPPEDSALAEERITAEVSSTVKAAEALVGSPSPTATPFRARRRKSRRLSLEMEKAPPEAALLAAVSRSHSAPITAAAARAAMGEAAWAEFTAGGGVPSPSPHYQPPPPSHGSNSDVPFEAFRSGKLHGGGGGGGPGLVMVEGSGESGSEYDTSEANTPAGNTGGEGYVKVNATRASSRRRSMDVYRKAVNEGVSADAAEKLAQAHDPSFNIHDNAAAAMSMTDEEMDLMDSPGGGSDYNSWTATAAVGGGEKKAYKSKWADYKPSGAGEEEVVEKEEEKPRKRFPDISV